MRARLQFVAILALPLLAACGTSAFDESPEPRKATLPPPRDPPTDRLREDFDSERLIAMNTGALIDVNAGTLSLAAAHFPDLVGEGENYVDGTMMRNGLLEGGDITVSPSSEVMASDSIELRAAHSVTVGGLMRVGPGGATIVARDRIEILPSAFLDSKGPIRMMIADPDGEIIVAGEVVARTTGESIEPAGIEIIGRGAVTVHGQLKTEAFDGQVGGDISIAVYNDVEVAGPMASIFAYAGPGSRAGTVRIRGDSEVRISDMAAVGRDSSFGTNGMDVPGRDGAIEIQGASILVDDDSQISANGPNGGGAIDLIARELIRTGERSQIVSGPGPVGGRLTLKASLIEIGVSSVVAAGSGVNSAGHLHMDAWSRIAIEPDARLRAGDGGCARGGDVRINVSGIITVSEPAQISAGNGATDYENLACSQQDPGGSIEITAHEMRGVEKAVRAGSPDGSINIRLDPELAIAPANLAVRTGGVVVSHPFSRSIDAVGLVPRLLDISKTEPMGTNVIVELSGADEADAPYGDWYDVDTADAKDLERLSQSVWFKYRVTLEGRAYDAPELDFFDIDLAPTY